MKHIYLLLQLVALFAAFCVGAEVPVTGLGLQLDLDNAFDLKRHGVTCIAINGAKPTDDGIDLPIAKGSKLIYDRVVNGGKVLFRGGVECHRGAKKMTIRDLSLDIKSGMITATDGGRTNAKFGSIDVSSAEVVKHEGSIKLNVKLDEGLHLHPSVISAIDDQLGTKISANVTEEENVDASAEFDVDIAPDGKINRDLATALGLDDDDIDELLDLGLDVDTRVRL